MRGRIPRAFGSGLLLLGAFAVGGVIHEAVVKGTIDPVSPVAVFGVLGGVLLIAIGLRLERRFEPSDYVSDADVNGDESEEGSEESETWGPVTEEMLEGRERDEAYDDQ